MPITMSARRMNSAALRASSGKDGSAMGSPSGCSSGRLPGVLLHRVLQKIQELRNGRQGPVPVGDKRKAARVLDEFGRGRPQALGEDRHGPLLGMTVKLE